VIRAIFAAISAEGRSTKRLDEIAAMGCAIWFGNNGDIQRRTRATFADKSMFI
jgi:hypothetical protein